MAERRTLERMSRDMIDFKEEKKGYCKTQVDDYIKTLNDEYIKVTEEYQTLLDEVKEEKDDTSQKDAIASALIKAELSGKQIIEEAKVEAMRITDGAKQETEKMNFGKQAIMREIKDLSTKLHLILEEDKANDASGQKEAIGHDG